MTWKNDEYYLKRTVELSKKAVEHGNTPFGALLVDEDGSIIMEQENIEITESDATGHAEATLVRKASKKYEKGFLNKCTLYSSAEPCAMCAGAIYWSNIGRVVYGISEKRLLELTGNHEQNPTLDLPIREVIAKGQRDVEIVGPVESLAEEIVEPHKGYWV